MIRDEDDEDDAVLLIIHTGSLLLGTVFSTNTNTHSCNCLTNEWGHITFLFACLSPSPMCFNL
jgi:hypothetical protein